MKICHILRKYIPCHFSIKVVCMVTNVLLLLITIRGRELDE